MREKQKIAVELAAVAAVLCTVIVLIQYGCLRFAAWEPAVFIGIPLVAAILLNLPNSELGLNLRHPLVHFKFFGLASLVFFPLFIAGYYLVTLFTQYRLFPGNIPQGWLRIVLAQYLYFGLPEEFLFRGYMQKRLGRVIKGTIKIARFELSLSGIICAAVFAFAHVLYDANAYRFLVFFPALVFAWLRYRTDSIIAPTLFHGTCNVLAKLCGADSW